MHVRLDDTASAFKLACRQSRLVLFVTYAS
jgi:hypothetical protein